MANDQYKEKMTRREKTTYTTVFRKLHDVMMEAKNKYIESFLWVKEYVESHLKNKVWDIKLSIHANDSPNTLKHTGRLNAPTVKEIAILLPVSYTHLTLPTILLV